MFYRFARFLLHAEPSSVSTFEPRPSSMVCCSSSLLDILPNLPDRVVIQVGQIWHLSYRELPYASTNHHRLRVLSTASLAIRPVAVNAKRALTLLFIGVF